MDEKKSIPSKDFPWKCSNCGFLLGYISSDSEILRIKYKDLYVTVKNGDTTILCRRCGTNNELTQNDKEM
jgi:DNA-directed RNA polymerase subunit RPC12/RpoP